jgi:hypothetical protein
MRVVDGLRAGGFRRDEMGRAAVERAVSGGRSADPRRELADTAAGKVITLSVAPGIVAAEPPVAKGGGTHLVPARSVLVLQRLD